MSGPAGRSKAPRVTVTHEKNKPVKLEPKKKDPVQAGLGNGVATTIIFDEPLVITATPPKLGAMPPTPANDTAKQPLADTPPAPQLVPDQTKPAPINKAGDGKIADEGAKADPVEQAKDGNQGADMKGPAATVATDGTIVFEPTMIVGRVPDPNATKAAKDGADDGGLTKLAPDDAKKVAPADAKTPNAAATDKGIDQPVPDDATVATEGKTPGAGGDAAGPPLGDKGKVVPDGVSTTEKKASGPAGSGGGTADLSAWHAKVSGAIGATPQPTLGKEPAAKVTVIAGTGKGAAARYKGGGGKAAAQVKDAVKPPPPAPVPLPPLPKTPVEAADKAIADASDHKLPEQTLPVIAARPAGSSPDVPTVPSVKLDVYKDSGNTIEASPLPEAAGPAAADAKDPKQSPDAKKIDKIKNAAAQKPEPRKGQPGQTLVLGDTAPPPAPRPESGTRGQDRGTVLQVLAELKRSPGPAGEAHKIVGEARAEAYPRKAVEMEYPSLGDTHEAAVTAELEKQVDGIAAVVGASQAELDAAMKAREATLDALKNGVKADIDTSGKEAHKDIEKGGEEAAADIWSARQAQDEDTIRKAEAATGEADPAVIELKRDKAVRELTYRAARQDVYYEKSGVRRARALDDARSQYSKAYGDAAKGDQDKIFVRLVKAEKDAGKLPIDAEKAAHTGAEAEAKPIFEWWARQQIELNAQFADLKDKAAAGTKGYRDGIKSALTTAKQLLADWAEKKIASQESWWESIVREFHEWMKDAKVETDAWEMARNEELRDSLTGDLQLIDDLKAAAGQGVDLKVYIEERGLDAAQGEVVKTYFARVGPEGKEQFDAVGAVAAGMRMRVSAARKPELIQWMKDQVLAMPDADWRHIAAIGNAERPPFDVGALGGKLWRAMDQWGTEEDDIYAALANLTPVQARAIRAWYQVKHHRSLDDHIKSELSDQELDRAQALLRGDQAMADAAALYDAMHGGVTGWGTDEDAIMRTLRNKSPEEQKAIVAAYKKQYNIDLDADIKSELDDGYSSQHDIDRATALREGDVAKADAIGLDATMHGGFGLGTDEGGITQIYEQNRAEVEDEGARKGWSTERVNAEIAKRNAKIEGKYEDEYGDPNKAEGQPSALRQAFASEMTDAELRLANAVADGDAAKIDIEKLAVEKESFVTSDDTVNAVLANQGKRARKDVERDAEVNLQIQAEADGLRGKPWDAARWGTEREASRKQVEADVKTRAMQYMGAVESGFDKQYGEGGLVLMIAFGTSGYEQQKAFDLRKQGGILEPDQEIHYAIAGVGTDLDKLKDTLKGKSPAEVEKIRQAWAKRYHRKPSEFDEEILDDVSGRDEQDMIWALEGEPQDLAAQIKRADERRDYEMEAYGVVGDYKEERAAIDSEHDYLVENYKSIDRQKTEFEEAKKLLAPKGEKESDQDYAKRQAKFADLSERLSYNQEGLKLSEGSFNAAIEDNRKAVDKFADTAATIAGIVATVIVMVVITIATWGAGTVAVGAALASAEAAATMAIVAASATIVTKTLIKGSAYTTEELATDAITGAVDAIASAATAGVGGGLLKGARAGNPVSKLAAWAAESKLAAGLSKMATSERMASRIFAGAMAEGIQGVAQTLPSALAGNVLNESNWVKGNPIANILQGTVMQVGMGSVVAGGMGGLGGIAKHVPESAVAHETGDILAKRGDPLDRLVAWKAWKVENPGKPYESFLGQFDAGILTKEADEAARHALQREMRGELLSAIPASERKAFENVSIEVLADADFEQLTKSSSGQAVVIFRDGSPTVIMREGADIKALREEGIHLAQSADPKFASAFKSIDETNLRGWSKMGLDEQLSLYKTKIEIELDGQVRLLKVIDEELADTQDVAVRKMLLAQREAAEATFGNLEKRLGEVAGISPLERLKMTQGEMPKPQYLDQEPRLFTKTSKIAQAASDPEFAAAAVRYADADKALNKVLAGIADDELRGMLGALVKDFKKSTRDFLDQNAAKVLDNKSFAKILAGTLPGREVFDRTLAHAGFAAAIVRLAEENPSGMKSAVQAMESILKNEKLSHAQTTPLISLVAKLEDPKRVVSMVEKLVELPNFRIKGITNVAEELDSVLAKKGKSAAEGLVEELEKMTVLTKERDAISKGTKPAEWEKAQKALDTLGDGIAGDARFGSAEPRLKKIMEEFSNSGRFDWDTFKAGLSQKYTLEKSAMPELRETIEKIRDGFKKSGKEWFDTDIGPILHWESALKEVYGTLDEAQKAVLMKKIKGILEEELPGRLNQQGYKNFRHAIRDEFITHIRGGKGAAEKFERMQGMMKFLRETNTDPATIGEYFAAYRRAVFNGTGEPAVQGALAGAKNIETEMRSIAGKANMVDGALSVNTARAIENGPQKAGIYLLEDKAGKSFSMTQAELYSELLHENKFKVGSSDPAKGLIYICEDPLHAQDIASKIIGLHPDIHIATFGPTGELVFVPRPIGPRFLP